MNDSTAFQSDIINTLKTPQIAGKDSRLLRLVRALQPVTRTEIANRLGIDKSTVAESVKPLITSGILREETLKDTGQGRRSRVISFARDLDYFIGVNLGVRTSQIGLTRLKGGIFEEDDFTTPPDAKTALQVMRERIEDLISINSGKNLRVIGVSVPGMTDPARQNLLSALNLGWHDVKIADALKFDGVKVVVETDSTAAAIYEAQMKIRNSSNDLTTNFILVRSGTGIGVGLVIGGEVYRGSGIGRGIAGKFGHMTIVTGGKSCVCGNRGCWEKYASAASAASLYLGDRPVRPNETMPRFAEIVSKAENGDIRAKRSLEKIGDYLGIGIANVIMGVGIPHVIISGRLVYGWNSIKQPMIQAIKRSVVGKIEGWTIEKGEPAGAALGGALEAAVEEYLTYGLNV